MNSSKFLLTASTSLVVLAAVAIPSMVRADGAGAGANSAQGVRDSVNSVSG